MGIRCSFTPLSFSLFVQLQIKFERAKLAREPQANSEHGDRRDLKMVDASLKLLREETVHMKRDEIVIEDVFKYANLRQKSRKS